MNTEKLSASEKELSGILFERGVDSANIRKTKEERKILKKFRDV